VPTSADRQRERGDREGRAGRGDLVRADGAGLARRAKRFDDDGEATSSPRPRPPCKATAKAASRWPWPPARSPRAARRRAQGRRRRREAGEAPCARRARRHPGLAPAAPRPTASSPQRSPPPPGQRRATMPAARSMRGADRSSRPDRAGPAPRVDEREHRATIATPAITTTAAGHSPASLPSGMTASAPSSPSPRRTACSCGPAAAAKPLPRPEPQPHGASDNRPSVRGASMTTRAARRATSARRA
jgi:hypothetical protein